MERILIDVNSSVLRGGRNYLYGIGRTTLDLINELAKAEQLPFEVQLYIQNLRGDASELKKSPFSKLEIPLPGAKNYKDIVTKLRVKEILTNYDMLHIPHNYEVVACPEKTLVTIHDAMFFSYPEDFLGHNVARNNYPKLAKNCKAIVTCSESSKSDIVNYMNIHPEKVTVIPWGISTEIYYPELKEILGFNLNAFKLQRPYFMMVSCNTGRKNTLSLLRAYKLFLHTNPEHDLVLVWNKPPSEIISEFYKEIQTERIHFLSGIDTNKLRSLYSGATATFFPSKYEGFGLPILESMACGTPVVTCRNSSLSEVGGEVALYTDPNNLEQMADFMLQFENASINISELKEKSLVHAAQFKWSRCADQYVQFYQKNI